MKTEMLTMIAAIVILTIVYFMFLVATIDPQNGGAQVLTAINRIGGALATASAYLTLRWIMRD